MGFATLVRRYVALCAREALFSLELVPAREFSAACLTADGEDDASLGYDVPAEFCNTN
jgi:hypothetical protein